MHFIAELATHKMYFVGSFEFFKKSYFRTSCQIWGACGGGGCGLVGMCGGSAGAGGGWKGERSWSGYPEIAIVVYFVGCKEIFKTESLSPRL